MKFKQKGQDESEYTSIEGGLRTLGDAFKVTEGIKTQAYTSSIKQVNEKYYNAHEQ